MDYRAEFYVTQRPPNQCHVIFDAEEERIQKSKRWHVTFGKGYRVSSVAGIPGSDASGFSTADDENKTHNKGHNDVRFPIANMPVAAGECEDWLFGVRTMCTASCPDPDDADGYWQCLDAYATGYAAWQELHSLVRPEQKRIDCKMYANVIIALKPSVGATLKKEIRMNTKIGSGWQLVAALNKHFGNEAKIRGKVAQTKLGKTWCWSLPDMQRFFTEFKSYHETMVAAGMQVDMIIERIDHVKEIGATIAEYQAKPVDTQTTKELAERLKNSLARKRVRDGANCKGKKEKGGDAKGGAAKGGGAKGDKGKQKGADWQHDSWTGGKNAQATSKAGPGSKGYGGDGK